MPYSNSPSLSTYETKRVSFISNPQQRSGRYPERDARLVNMMVEEIDSPVGSQKQFFVKSRPGLAPSHLVNSGTARGIFYWDFHGVPYTITVVDAQIYYNGTFLANITTTTGPVGFTLFVASTGVVTLVMVDGTKGYEFSDPTVPPTTITSPDFPTPHLPFPIFMDGYLFLAKPDSQDIYNSNLDDATLWTAGDYISAEMYPDTIKALSKNNNYIYAIGNDSVEYFLDAANATGSPLQRHESAVQQFGIAAPYTVVQTEKEVIFIGQTGNGGHTVWTIDGFKEKEIGIPAIKNAFLEEGSDLDNATAFSLRVCGQKLYVIRLTSRTLVYSFDTKMWHEWASGTTNESTFVGAFAADGPEGTAYVLNAGGGVVYNMSEDYLDDNGVTFMQEITMAKEDFDTFNQKTMSRFTIIGDEPLDAPDSASKAVSIEWSDDDYRTWKTARTLRFENDFPCIAQLGRFRRRAFRIRYTAPYFIRWEGIEVDINKGNQ